MRSGLTDSTGSFSLHAVVPPASKIRLCWSLVCCPLAHKTNLFCLFSLQLGPHEFRELLHAHRLQSLVFKMLDLALLSEIFPSTVYGTAALFLLSLLLRKSGIFYCIPHLAGGWEGVRELLNGIGSLNLLIANLFRERNLNE